MSGKSHGSLTTFFRSSQIRAVWVISCDLQSESSSEIWPKASIKAGSTTSERSEGIDFNIAYCKTE
jgi:hypothetical protein